jgi:hypothetical protein
MLLTRQCRSLSTPGCESRRVTRSVLITPAARVPGFSGPRAQTNGVLTASSISRRPGSCNPCRSAAGARNSKQQQHSRKLRSSTTTQQGLNLTLVSPLCFCADTNVSTAAAGTPTVLYVSELDASVKGDDLTSHFKCVLLTCTFVCSACVQQWTAA